MGFMDWLRGHPTTDVTETASTTAPARVPGRTGFEYGIGPGGLTETNQGVGTATQTDRRSLMQQLYETYLSCTWAWAAVNAVARTVTAGGLVTDWTADDGEGDMDQPTKPANVLALERLLAYCNPREDIRQLMRSVVSDLEVFGDAFIEVVWVGNLPVSLYSLDSPSMLPVADQHGNITGYVQVTEQGQRATFEPRDVIHISLDSPRSGIFGVSPTQAALLPITKWLFTAATLKETFRKGNPPILHVDMPAGMQSSEINRWTAQHMQRNVGPRNIGMPITTKGDAKVAELQAGRLQDYLHTLDQSRDEVIATYGVPPAELGIIESGNLGGGTGESQRKTFLVNTCQPIAELVLEKLNFHIARLGFGVQGWVLKFGEVDMRDSEVVEKIRDMRLRNGSWTLNKYRTVIGEPPVDGGDAAAIIETRLIMLWRDLEAYSKSAIVKDLSGSDIDIPDPGNGVPADLVKVALPASPSAPAVAAGDDTAPPEDQTTETYGYPGRVSRATWSVYRQRLAEALRDLPDDRAA